MIAIALLIAAISQGPTILDLGNWPCRDLVELSKRSPVSYDREMKWELGFWSGLNAASASLVGGASLMADPFTITAEIRRECDASPDDPLWKAETRVYERFKSKGR